MVIHQWALFATSNISNPKNQLKWTSSSWLIGIARQDFHSFQETSTTDSTEMAQLDTMITKNQDQHSSRSLGALMRCPCLLSTPSFPVVFCNQQKNKMDSGNNIGELCKRYFIPSTHYWCGECLIVCLLFPVWLYNHRLKAYQKAQVQCIVSSNWEHWWSIITLYLTCNSLVYHSTFSVPCSPALSITRWNGMFQEIHCIFYGLLHQ